MNILGIAISSRFFSYSVVDERNKIHLTGIEETRRITPILNDLVMVHELQGIAVESTQFSTAKLLNKHQFRCIELLGVFEQYSRMRGLCFYKYSKQEIAIALTGSSRSPDSIIQKALMFRMGLRKIIKPINISAAVAAAYHSHNMIKKEM